MRVYHACHIMQISISQINLEFQHRVNFKRG